MGGIRSSTITEDQSHTTNNNPTKFEVATLALSLVAILLSAYSTHVSYENARNLTDYQINQQMEQQILFDKQGAAKQFAIEISSINPLIQSYAVCYFNNFDLTSKGKNIFVDRNSDTYLLVNSSDKTLTRTPFLLILNNDTVKEARVIITPMNTDNNGNDKVNINLPDSKNSIDDCVLSNPIIPSQLYNDHGMYYTYIQDIPKFNSQLAYDLDTFYYEISSAEADRKYIQEYLATQERSQERYVLENQYFVAYMNMRVNIMKASKLAPRIIEELNEEISKNNNI
jgi:hypothetical protein